MAQAMSHHFENRDLQPEVGNERHSKKSYTTPQLVEYGNIRKLTLTGNGSGADGGVAGMQMVCL